MDFARKCIAEFFGTTMFVLIGCLGISMYASTLDALGLCLIFAFVFIAMYFVIGRVSGCHLNPAVSLGMAITGRISWKEFAGYAVSQLVGGFAACGLITLFNSLFGVSGYSANAVYVDTYKYPYVVECLVIEIILTMLFVLVFLAATKKGRFSGVAGIGIGLSLLVFYVIDYGFTGASLNPARQPGPRHFHRRYQSDERMGLSGRPAGRCSACRVFVQVLCKRNGKRRKRTLNRGRGPHDSGPFWAPILHLRLFA